MKKSILCVALCLSGLLFLFLAQKINLPAADLGRHIKNGEILLHAGEYNISRSALLHTNFFSYTHPDFPFINHHWGYGIIAYLTYTLFGWTGLSLAYIFTLIGAFLLLLLVNAQKTPLYASIPISLFLIPLIAERTEIRPEGMSYFFTALFLFILIRYSQDKLKQTYLYILPVLSVFWINMHIYAVFGALIVGAFLCEAIIRCDTVKIHTYIKILALCSVALLISPYGLEGALYPFKIFGNYGYLVAENQSIPFLQRINFENPNFLWWKLSAVLALFGGAFTLLYHKHKFPIALSLITVAFAGLSFFGIRHLTLFGLILLPFFLNISELFFEKNISEDGKHNAWATSLILSLIIGIFVGVQFSSRLPGNHSWGLGLFPHNIDSVEFIKKTGVRGPFFSNYDIGGLIIFSLFTPDRQEKVFVDNRPETYPKEFFSDVYIPMQENTDVWERVLNQYNFNAIWFYRLDATPWAQNFLITHINDPAWAPVYVDDFTIVFVRRNEQNADIIKTYELPQSMFGVTN